MPMTRGGEPPLVGPGGVVRLPVAGASLSVIVADPDPVSRAALAQRLGGTEFLVSAVGSGAQLLAAVRARRFDCAAVDTALPDIEPAQLLARLREASPGLKIAVIAATPGVKGAAAAFAAGASDYIAKDTAVDELPGVLASALSHAEAEYDEAQGAGGSDAAGPDGLLIGTSPRMVAVYKLVARVADLPSTVLITGETGSGKEQIARAIHATGRRASAPFVAVDCAAVPETLFESEFFGHEKGAFTGAHAARTGVLEAAGAGTCFLDEIGELPLHLQAKLLRALQEKSVRRVGGSRSIPIDARIVCATNRDLAEDVRRGTFREDLYYRLNVVPIHLPPLRERPDDIQALVRHFAARFSDGRATCRVSPEAMEVLLRYPWPGNVRQLENVIERSVALTPYGVILPADLPAEIAEADRIATAIGLDPETVAGDPVALRELNRRHIEAILKKTGGNKVRAAQMLGIDRRTLYRILERTRHSENDRP